MENKDFQEVERKDWVERLLTSNQVAEFFRSYFDTTMENLNTYQKEILVITLWRVFNASHEEVDRFCPMSRSAYYYYRRNGEFHYLHNERMRSLFNVFRARIIIYMHK